jgi:2-oxoglutarate ferredoxin oxidoreductase subunit alpha
VPGYGEGLIAADSDEHDEAGHITESMLVRTAQMNKRLAKRGVIEKNPVLPVLTGPEDFKVLLVGWGSTCQAIREGLERSGRTDTAHLHFPQVYPFPYEAQRYLQQADKVFVIENNATAQFGRILTLHGYREPDGVLLKYNGLAFHVEELAEEIGELD